MRRPSISLIAGLALATAAPASAQEAPEAASETGEDAFADAFDFEAILGGMFGDLYAEKPLSPEQAARLPAASAAAAVALPDGLYGRIMRQAVDGLVTPLMDKFAVPSREDLAGRVGLGEDDIPELDEDQRKHLATLLDPHAQERTRIMLGGVMSALETVFGHVEGPMREGLAKVYAARFTGPQLGEINAFLATPTGQTYAAESLAAFTDPQMMGAMMRSLPSVMSVLPETMMRLQMLEGSVPEPRTFADIPPAERDELAAALGLTVEELEVGMALAAEEADIGEALDEEDGEWDEGEDGWDAMESGEPVET